MAGGTSTWERNVCHMQRHQYHINFVAGQARISRQITRDNEKQLAWAKPQKIFKV